MKRQTIILIIMVVLLAGCATLQKAVPQTPAEPIEPPKPIETVAPPEILIEPQAQEPKLTKAEEALGIEVIRAGDAQDAVSINAFDTRRISRDRGELRSINITIRNGEDKEIAPQVTLWFRTTDYEKPEKVVIERIIDVPRLAPMRKYTKRYPVTIYYDDIEEMKDIEILVHDLSVGPKKKLGETKRSFTPVEAFPTMEIHW